MGSVPYNRAEGITQADEERWDAEEKARGGRPPARFHAGTIQTFTGQPFDFANPDPATINLDDIAHALSNACRFAGHTKRFYSVAEHCVRVSEILEYRGFSALDEGRLARHGLMHDAAEAYVWDCPSPFKPLLGAVYKEFTAKADAAIAERFGLDAETFHCPAVKGADECALVAEARILMHYPPEVWKDWEDRYSKVPAPPQGAFGTPEAVGWSPTLAKEAFHNRAKEVGLCE